LKHPQVPACGGSWMVKSTLIADGRFDEITRLTREAIKIASQAEKQ
jgi:2-dehydro-3-deoxyphosphogluconate aldolase/(4S)-4-hydroxy-2-oxoglutarate aldolase